MSFALDFSRRQRHMRIITLLEGRALIVEFPDITKGDDVAHPLGKRNEQNDRSGQQSDKKIHGDPRPARMQHHKRHKRNNHNAQKQHDGHFAFDAPVQN